MGNILYIPANITVNLVTKSSFLPLRWFREASRENKCQFERNLNKSINTRKLVTVAHYTYEVITEVYSSQYINAMLYAHCSTPFFLQGHLQIYITF
jgi:hypothetical protein